MANQRVFLPTAKQPVALGVRSRFLAAVKRIDARKRIDPVVARAAIYLVVADLAEEDIIAVIPLDEIVAG